MPPFQALAIEADDETTEPTVRIVQHARAPMMAGRERDLERAVLVIFPIVQFVNALEAEIVPVALGLGALVNEQERHPGRRARDAGADFGLGTLMIEHVAKGDRDRSAKGKPSGWVQRATGRRPVYEDVEPLRRDVRIVFRHSVHAGVLEGGFRRWNGLVGVHPVRPVVVVDERDAKRLGGGVFEAGVLGDVFKRAVTPVVE